jgi:hypothetical protein
MNEELYAGRVGRPSTADVTVIPGGDGTPIPDCPATVKDSGNWERLWTVGRSWLSNDAHYDLMRLLCEAIDDRERIRRQMKRQPVILAGSTGQTTTHPGFRQIDAADLKIARLLDQAGFSPTKHRTKAASPKGTNRLDDIRSRARGDG